MTSLVPLRKSGRESKKPAFFQFASARQQSPEVAAATDEENEHSSDEDIDTIFNTEKATTKKRKSKADDNPIPLPDIDNKAKKSKKPRKGKGNVSFEGLDPVELDEKSIFGLVKNAKDLKTCIDEWMKSFKVNLL